MPFLQASVPESLSNPLVPEPAQKYTPADIDAIVLDDSTLQALPLTTTAALLEM
jgi:hypothetical protein